MALNHKQKQFYKEWLIDANATQAAIRAGYSKKSAYSQGQRLLKNVEGQKYLAELMAEKESELIASQDEVLKYLTSVMRGKSQSTEIVVEGIGDGCSEARTVLKEPSGAWEILLCILLRIDDNSSCRFITDSLIVSGVSILMCSTL